MAKRTVIPIDTLRQLLRLDQETGKLYWRLRGPEWFRVTERRTAKHACENWNARFAGREALATPDAHGYLVGTLLCHRLKAHRVVFALHHDRWPVDEIDHRDRDRRNNKPMNLREATKRQNAQNSGAKGGVSRFCGVYRNRVLGKWQATCKDHDGVYRYLGVFCDEEDAARAYDAAAQQWHGEFALLNFP